MALAASAIASCAGAPKTFKRDSTGMLENTWSSVYRQYLHAVVAD